MRRALLPLLIVLPFLAAPAAEARVLLLATGDSAGTLTDVQSGNVVARVPMPGRSRAVAVAPDGVRGYVGAAPASR
jgi:hypothetical protein